jgi:hypothetical protein
VAQLLRGLGYSLQANRKEREGTAHPDRDAQFQHLNTTATRALDALEQEISVDTKKKELVGDAQERQAGMAPQGFTRAGPGARRRRTRGTARRFPLASFRLASEEGWEQIGIDHDTAQFAVNSIRGWWEHLGRQRYPDARPAFGHRRLRWRQRLSYAPVEGRGAAPCRRDRAGDPGLSLPAGHRAPWNTIEQRLFSCITSNCRGKPLTELATIVNLIAATRSGLKVCLVSTRAAPPSMSRSHMPGWKPSTCTDTPSNPTSITP